MVENRFELPWKVMPCPIHHGKHPCHDQRWIVTADAEVEFPPYGPEGEATDWGLSSGHAIAQLRDVVGGTGDFIVTACNSHDDLLAACIRMLVAYEADKARGVAFGNDAVADECRAAIAKAEDK